MSVIRREEWIKKESVIHLKRKYTKKDRYFYPSSMEKNDIHESKEKIRAHRASGKATRLFRTK